MKPNDYDLQPVDSYDEYEEIQPAESNNKEKKEKKEQPDKLLAVTNSIDQVCQTVNSATTTVAEAVKSIADVRLQIETMDHELSMFIVESQKNLEKFQQFAPMLEKQLENASSRIDRITDTILAQSSASLTPESLQKQQMLASLLSQTNDIFNNLLVKMISI